MDGLPDQVKMAKLAAKVRALANTNKEAAWKKLEQEAVTQKLVWGSLRLVSDKDYQSKIDALQAEFDTLLSTLPVEPELAVRMLEMALKGAEEHRDILSNVMKKSSQDVIRQENAVADRLRLAEKLEARSMPALPEEKRELEDLVVKCYLDNRQLERHVRKLLALPPLPVEVRSEAEAFVPPARTPFQRDAGHLNSMAFVRLGSPVAGVTRSSPASLTYGPPMNDKVTPLKASRHQGAFLRASTDGSLVDAGRGEKEGRRSKPKPRRVGAVSHGTDRALELSRRGSSGRPEPPDVQSGAA